jgi:lysozyme family protein
LRAVGNVEPRKIIEDMHQARQAFYERLSTFKTFGRGWTRRNKETLEQSLKMLV